MKKSLAVTCLLLSLSAHAGAPMCLDSYPIECQRLCAMLRYNASVPTDPEYNRWLYGYHSVPGDSFTIDVGCDADIQAAQHTAAECAYAKAWIMRWDFSGGCRPFWYQCMVASAQCMRADLSWDTCFCDNPVGGWYCGP
jgi:hypothetical protein